MSDPTRPLLAVYVVWHPDFVDGPEIAEALRAHFRKELYQNIAGGTGLSVIYRSEPPPGDVTPLSIDITESETSAVVVLLDPTLVGDGQWKAYIQNLENVTDAAGLGARLFPVFIDPSGSKIGLKPQAFRWDQWVGSIIERGQRLTFELTYEFCRMLRHYLEHLKHPTDDDEALQAYVKKVQIFLSHSKHDADGQRIAKAIRDALHAGHGLASFFDVNDIPAGLPFDKVLLLHVRVSAVVAIHTDSYSSREWCRREVLEAKRCHVPMVVANCISDVDERNFPYMGNVPVIRLDPKNLDRIDLMIGRLLDEVLKDFLWRCRVELYRATAGAYVVFVPRPPELIALATLPPIKDVPTPTVVYPDPPLGAEEEALFRTVAPHVRLLSLTAWLATP